MSTEMVIELIGYLGSLLVLVSFLMSSVVKLRIVNSVGALIFTIYAIIIHSYPTALMNACLIGINIYYLVRLTRPNRHYTLVNASPEDACVQYFLDHYKEDIKKFFPEWTRGKPDTACLVCCDAALAGVLLGALREDGTLEIQLDYATPEYRDCSVGTYLYAQLSARGIRRLAFPYEQESHRDYLNKMGFVSQNGSYVKELGAENAPSGSV